MPSNLFDLTGKVVVATGANSGIGLALLQGCAKQGADVVVWSRRDNKNAEALALLSGMGARRVLQPACGHAAHAGAGAVG